MSSNTLIFVYGSLKRGYALHSLLTSQRFLGTAQTVAHYRLFDLGEYPGLIDVNADALLEPWLVGLEGLAIHGELYEVSTECLERLDEAEGVNERLYERRRVLLAPPMPDQHVFAWFYLQGVENCRDCGTSWP